MRKTIAIVGVGLIGGSLALQLHAKKISGRLIGVELNPEHARTALELEIVDEIMALEKAIKEADIIAVALPVDVLTGILPAILDLIDRQIVFDLGSTKKQVTDAVREHRNRKRYVATHPMWGTENSGPGAAVHGAFQDRAAVICDRDDSDEDALEWVTGMYRKIGMRLVYMPAKEHDLHTAYVSHVSHITSFALANTVLEKEKEDQAIFELASGGFESTVRLAKSHAAMWVPIFLQNKDHMIDVITEHIVQIEKFKLAIEKGEEETLRSLIENANMIRRILK